jgi:hypothetical protein
MSSNELLQQYARDPRNVRRQIQEADDAEAESPVAVTEEKPQPAKKSKK